MLGILDQDWTHESRFPGRKPGDDSLNIIADTPYESLRHQEVVKCNECGAVVLGDATGDHSDWHDRQTAAATIAVFPNRYSISLDRDGDPVLACNDCSKDATISELGYLRLIEPGESFGYVVDRILSHERGVHA